ncbi:MAG: hypothetical protein ACYCQK_02085 [Acidiferrobacteraceae bacterium]
MGTLAPGAIARANDPKRRPGAYIRLGEKRVYWVVGECEGTVLLEVENILTEHRSTLALYEVAQCVLVKPAPPDEQPLPGSHWMGAYEQAIDATPTIPDPDDGRGAG